ncbi:MAG: MBOAT family protein [Cytophagaceae bacterium]|nr:MBOAT family protein [Gemmatimonadaceae bacterium]
MLFNSVIFLFAFLPITYLVFWGLRAKQARYIWLTLTGYIFYGYWDPRFCLLMAFSTLVSYFAGLGFLKYTNPKQRKLCLVIPIAVDLLMLAFFKYFNFALDSVRGIGGWFGADVALPHLNIILPVGISFYTFHTITYIVDAYRGVITPTRNFFEFSTYVSLFSQLVAGPIVRFRQVEADLEALDNASRTRWIVPGVQFFLVGLVEKVLIADSIAAFVDPALQNWDALSTLGTWMAMLGYTFQLYFDFSGYSSMAVGLGYLFGIRIPRNFNSPYKALDPSDFWQRWHISLSSVLRDYLYIPLGGNRNGTFQTYRNLMITMLLGGLWHGASWVFVIWGAYHGLLLCAYRVFDTQWNALPRVARQLGMFFLVVIGWVFFRATSFSMATGLLRQMFVPTEGILVPGSTLAALAIGVAAWWSMIGPNAFDLEVRDTWPRRVAFVAAFAACLAIIAGTRSSPFLYFQF